MPDELNHRVDRLVDAVEALRVAINRRTKWASALLGVIVLAGVLTIGAEYYLIYRNNQKWCGTLNILTDPSAPPPTTARGRDQLAQLESLRIAFNCKRQDMP